MFGQGTHPEAPKNRTWSLLGWGGGPHLCHGQVTDPGCSPKAEAFLSCATVSWIFALEAQSVPFMNSLHLPRKVAEFSHALALGTHHYVRAPWVLPCPFTLFSPNPPLPSPLLLCFLPLHTQIILLPPLKPWFYGWTLTFQLLGLYDRYSGFHLWV